MRVVKKVICECCGQEISKSNYSKHIRRHENNPGSFKEPKYALDHDGLVCKFCGKVCKNRNSLCNHERLCLSNPDRQQPSNGGISNFDKFNADRKAGLISSWNKGLTKETDSRVAQGAATFNTRFAAGQYKRQSKPHENTFCSKYKYGTYCGYYCDSSWELAFLIYHLD